ncbi:MAG: hypothetical protein CMJ19_19705 [Phycisphaeraceae bacterium]|nr:hypothetical protein [Phycisphaeraceae bacterium]
MTQLYVDTNAFLARFNRQDNLYEVIKPSWQTIMQKKTRLITTNEVVCQTLSRVAMKESPELAATVGRLLLNFRQLTIEPVTRQDQLEAFKLLKKFSDQAIGYTDCPSFAVMQRLGLQQVFSQDHHFAIAGFELWPGKIRTRRKKR